MLLFQATVLAITILLLTAAWLIFQQAKSELSARAAETPVLNEIRALHKSIKQLLTDIEDSADKADVRLERRCLEARDLMHALEIKLCSAVTAPPSYSNEAAVPSSKRRSPTKNITAALTTDFPIETNTPQSEYMQSKPFEMSQASLNNTHSVKNRAVFDLADAGEDRTRIARATGMSEGEVETLLGLRMQRQDARL